MMDQETAVATIAAITSIEAIELKNGKFQIDAVFANGERETLKAQSNSMPSMVQAFSYGVNGNYKGDGIGKYFTFSKSVAHYFKKYHIKAFIVGATK